MVVVMICWLVEVGDGVCCWRLVVSEDEGGIGMSGEAGWMRTFADSPPIRIVCISDTHNTTPLLPTGDVLLHAGDITQSGTLPELLNTLSYLQAQPHRHKIVIAGNHDTCLTTPSVLESIDWGDVIYLENTGTTLKFEDGRALTVFGSPFTPKHGSGVFQYPREQDVWSSGIGDIPQDTDVLVTHGPPAFHLDCGGMGCRYLLRKLWEVRPRLHVFGHIHHGRGTQRLAWDEVQARFERVCRARKERRVWSWGVVRDVIGLLLVAVGMKVSGRVRREEQETVLVNAAIVHGFRDEKMHEPIVVDFYK
ncbi:Metallo-dependent phosphatase [Ascobolus immersus RN42]|uniref:Metallo-dependent phosphatase n=1 Tax=Ascobolus immersus RN42 TaxID=1160509 RepID=A0A3N4IP46_ASCIM|nr:Metallo-dependent phosphatase [Ascobolus immersus RN42]